MLEVLKGFVISLAVFAASCWLALKLAGSLLILVAIPFAASLVLPLAMPTGKWLAGCIAFFLLGIAGVLAQHLYVTSQAPHNGGPGEVVGLAIFAYIVCGFILGTLVKLGLMIVKARRTASNSSLERTRGRKSAKS